ncbi:MAG: cation-transporting P-type ATPase, partial [Neofamilia sp.]
MNNKITQLDFENLTDNQRLLWASDADQTELFEILETSLKGKNEEQIEDAREKFGENKVIYKKKKGIIRELIDAFINPFTIVLIVLAVVSTVTDIFLAQP